MISCMMCMNNFHILFFIYIILVLYSLIQLIYVINVCVYEHRNEQYEENLYFDKYELYAAVSVSLCVHGAL